MLDTLLDIMAGDEADEFGRLIIYGEISPVVVLVAEDSSGSLGITLICPLVLTQF